ncbi:MAG: glycosyltransferase family 2 protein [Candidatus Eisenbacteria bacterium]|uniref:Glycosyltransferase family 2 protein n=1 Tax=Eiseniibacteriota bacterium TaxID=2212470 RepID=A0A7Y2EHF3_UNCEI|nr:glycosyltransferase family 2 protein [Candidatus Eisenbacteria bacterium]
MMLSVLIPVFNEEATLEKVVRSVLEIDLEKEIVVVDDCSTDQTPAIIKKLEEEGVIRAFRLDRNQGKGAAVRKAITEAKGEICVIQDADLEYQPSDFPALIRPIIEFGADACYGSRFSGPHRVFLYWHYAANRLLTWLTNMIYDTMLTDMETGYKAVRTEVLRSFNLRSNTFDIEPEITAKLFKNNYKVFEVPITYNGRTYAEGKKIGVKDAFLALAAILRFRFTD